MAKNEKNKHSNQKHKQPKQSTTAQTNDHQNKRPPPKATKQQERPGTKNCFLRLSAKNLKKEGLKNE